MPGFAFRYRLSGAPPTIRAFPGRHAGAVSSGDLVDLRDGALVLGVTGGARLLGATVQPGADGSFSVVTDADAVYALDDPSPRTKGSTLALAGTTGAQGVAESGHADLAVVDDSTPAEPTLVCIPAAHHRTLRVGNGRRRLVGGELNAAVSRAVVRHHNEHLGRGPTRARSFHRDNVIVVVLEDAMTKAERSLAAGGHADAVRRVRAALQDAMRADLVATIEALTGCTVEVCMSTSHVDPDMAAELFVLDRPVPGGAVS